MKKLAVCLYGFLRDYEKCYKSLMNKIVKPHNADVYIFTPNQRSADNFDDIVTTSNLKKAYNTNHIKRWNYNRVNFIRDANFLPKYNVWYQRPFRGFSMAFHISKSTQMIKKSYKWIYLTRPDVPVSFFDLSKANLNKINLRVGGHLCNPHNTRLDDKYILGSQESIKIFDSFYKDMKKDYIYDKKVPFIMNGFICHHIIKNNIEINHCRYIADITKHNCSKLCGHHLIANNLKDKCKADNEWFYFRKDKLYK